MNESEDRKKSRVRDLCRGTGEVYLGGWHQIYHDMEYFV